MTKHGVVGLTRALRIEAAPRGVRVSALCPGVIHTPILRGGAFGRFTRTPTPEAFERMFALARPMDPHAFAKEALDLVAANEETIIVPRTWRAMDKLLRHAPRLARAILTLAFERMKAEFERAPKRPVP